MSSARAQNTALSAPPPLSSGDGDGSSADARNARVAAAAAAEARMALLNAPRSVHLGTSNYDRLLKTGYTKAAVLEALEETDGDLTHATAYLQHRYTPNL
jgi:hypothetical protein